MTKTTQSGQDRTRAIAPLAVGAKPDRSAPFEPRLSARKSATRAGGRKMVVGQVADRTRAISLSAGHPSRMNALMTTQEVAQVLRTHPKTVKRYVRAGKLKRAAVIGRAYRFTAQAVEAFLAKNTGERSPHGKLISTQEVKRIRDAA